MTTFKTTFKSRFPGSNYEAKVFKMTLATFNLTSVQVRKNDELNLNN